VVVAAFRVAHNGLDVVTGRLMNNGDLVIPRSLGMLKQCEIENSEEDGRWQGPRNNAGPEV
jgi:hypothetical protein